MHARARQVISTALGYVLPNLISRKATQHAASVLYTVFGLRLLWIAWHSKPQETNQVTLSALYALPVHSGWCDCFFVRGFAACTYRNSEQYKRGRHIALLTMAPQRFSFT